MEENILAPDNSERRIYRDYDDNPRPLPAVEEIRRLVSEDPVVVVSFCQQLYRSDIISTEEKCDIAVKLLPKVEPQYRVFVWGALSGMIRIYVGPPISVLYDLAKETLENPKSTKDEQHAIREFLGDLQYHYVGIMYWMTQFDNPPVKECDLFVAIRVYPKRFSSMVHAATRYLNGGWC